MPHYRICPGLASFQKIYLTPSFFASPYLTASVNFWKSLNLSGAKIIILLLSFHFSTKQENGKKIKHIMTKHRSLLHKHVIQCTKYSVLLLIFFMVYVFIIITLPRPGIYFCSPISFRILSVSSANFPLTGSL